jgi:hypothetical protein
MIKKNVIRKSWAIVIIILFVGLAITPGTYAIFNGSNTIRLTSLSFNFQRNPLNTVYSSDEDVVEILVNKHNPDGSIEKNIVSLSRERVYELVEELIVTKIPEEKLSIIKKYELIPQNFKDEQLKTDKLLKSHQLRIIQKKMEKFSRISSFFNNFLAINTSINTNCSVSGEILGGMKYLFGLSALTGFINFAFKLWYMSNRLKSIDLIDIFVTEKGKLDAVNGSSPDIHTGEDKYFIAAIVGFSGYFIIFPPLPGILIWGQFYGDAVLVAVILSGLNT